MAAGGDRESSMAFGQNAVITFSNISATPTAFLLRGGLYAVTAKAT